MNFETTIPKIVAEFAAADIRFQAAVNDPSRHRRDWSDIHLLVENAASQGSPLDWDLLSDYLALFDLIAELGNLKQLYGQTL